MSNNLVAESVLAVRSPSQLDPDTHAECLGFVRSAIASNDRQTALDIKNVLAEVCENGYANRTAIWAELSQAEQQSFKELLAPPPIAPPELQTALFPIDGQAIRLGQWVEARAIGWNDEGTQLVVEYLRASGDMGEMLVFPERFASTELIALPAETSAPTPEPELTAPAPEPTPEPQTAEPETAITPEDAEKMREIALVWWPEMYHPETLQSLIVQMWGWGAPGTKYDAATVTAWLALEDELVRDRISELWQLKHGEGLDSLDCGF